MPSDCVAQNMPLPVTRRAAARDINKPIKASEGAEVSWPEFPSRHTTSADAPSAT